MLLDLYKIYTIFCIKLIQKWEHDLNIIQIPKSGKNNTQANTHTHLKTVRPQDRRYNHVFI